MRRSVLIMHMMADCVRMADHEQLPNLDLETLANSICMTTSAIPWSLPPTGWLLRLRNWRRCKTFR